MPSNINVCKIPHITELKRKKPQKFALLKLESIWIIPSVLTCDVITLWSPICFSSAVCACMAEQRRWNFGVKTSPFAVSSCENQPFPCVVVMNDDMQGQRSFGIMLLIGSFFLFFSYEPITAGLLKTFWCMFSAHLQFTWLVQ